MKFQQGGFASLKLNLLQKEKNGGDKNVKEEIKMLEKLLEIVKEKIRYDKLLANLLGID